MLPDFEVLKCLNEYFFLLHLSTGALLIVFTSSLPSMFPTILTFRFYRPNPPESRWSPSRAAASVEVTQLQVLLFPVDRDTHFSFFRLKSNVQTNHVVHEYQCTTWGYSSCACMWLHDFFVARDVHSQRVYLQGDSLLPFLRLKIWICPDHILSSADKQWPRRKKRRRRGTKPLLIYADSSMDGRQKARCRWTFLLKINTMGMNIRSTKKSWCHSTEKNVLL